MGPGANLGDLSGLANGARFDMVSGEPFDADKAYKDSKLCNALFMRELAQRLRKQGSPATVNAFGPGAPEARASQWTQACNDGCRLPEGDRSLQLSMCIGPLDV